MADTPDTIAAPASPAAEVPDTFPSLPTPGAGDPVEALGASRPRVASEPARSQPSPGGAPRPSPAALADAQDPATATVAALGGSGAFPSASAIAAAIAAVVEVDAVAVHADVEAGTVTLEGAVARALDRDRLVAALARVPGVVEVVDHLRLRLEA